MIPELALIRVVLPLLDQHGAFRRDFVDALSGGFIAFCLWSPFISWAHWRGGKPPDDTPYRVALIRRGNHLRGNMSL